MSIFFSTYRLWASFRIMQIIFSTFTVISWTRRFCSSVGNQIIVRFGPYRKEVSLGRTPIGLMVPLKYENGVRLLESFGSFRWSRRGLSGLPSGKRCSPPANLTLSRHECVIVRCSEVVSQKFASPLPAPFYHLSQEV